MKQLNTASMIKTKATWVNNPAAKLGFALTERVFLIFHLL